MTEKAVTEVKDKIVESLDAFTDMYLRDIEKHTFTMAEARTYVIVQGSVRVDILFLDLDFFNRLLVEAGTDIEEQISSMATI